MNKRLLGMLFFILFKLPIGKNGEFDHFFAAPFHLYRQLAIHVNKTRISRTLP